MSKEKKIAIVIQARMQSSRLPGKVMKELGDKVLDRVLFEQNKPNEVDNFGVRINASNISLHNSSIREDRELWKTKNPQDVNEIKNLEILK